MELSSPVLSDAVVEEIRRHEVLGMQTIAATFPLKGGKEALRESLHRLRSEAEFAVHEGYNIICLSDKEAFNDGLAPIPTLLALGAVHNYLCNQGLRERCSIIVQAGDVQEGHDIAVLVAFGADAVHPYLMLRLIRQGLTFKEADTKQEWSLTPHECLENLFLALEDSLKKIISKMGITTIEGYRGAMLFEAVGFGQELMEFLGDCPSRIGGIGLAELVEDAQWRLQQAEKMTVLGRNRDYHAFNAKVRMALRKAALAGSAASLPVVDPEADGGREAPGEITEAGGEDAYQKTGKKKSLRGPKVEDNSPEAGEKAYREFTDLVNNRTLTVLRDLFLLNPQEPPVAIEEVQDALDLVRNYFRGAAMSHGALTRDSHETIAAALNDLEGYSNLSRFMQPDMALCRIEKNFPQRVNRLGMVAPGVCRVELSDKPSLNDRILEAARDAVDSCFNVDMMFKIRNGDRSVGAAVAGMIARLYGREGMPNNKRIRVRFDGEAGQSFGAWCLNGLELDLHGFAQDGVAKGMSGGMVVVTLDYDQSDYGGELQSVAGNNVGYGATGGIVFVGGRAGHRLGIRNSGATIVAEAAGKYACEYLTRGRVVILGPIENEIGSGMTGGELFVYDPKNEVPSKIHSRSVAVIECTYVDYEWMHPLVIQFHSRTGSRQAEMILKNWGEIRRSKKLKKIVPLAVARKAEEFITAGTNAG